jgi:phage baseplate assembly protein W
MNRHTGKAIEGVAHLRQSIGDILATPLGSRVMRRDYGSRLFELIDTPVSPASVVDYASAVAGALVKWEPRVVFSRCSITGMAGGKITLSLDCAVSATGENFTHTLTL